MMKAVARQIGIKKSTTRPFKDFYEEWITTLKNILLPLLQRSISNLSSSPNNNTLLLSTHVQMLHHNFHTLYYALDQSASQDISQLLYPSWRNPIEKPFLWFADFHPNLFINLLRSFLNTDNDELTFTSAWENPTSSLVHRIEQIECGSRLLVPTFVTRARKAQSGCISKVAGEWVGCAGKEEACKVIGDAVVGNSEELVSVFLDANRLRRSILTEIICAMNLVQAAIYLQGLAKFYVGFRDVELVKEFEQCKFPILFDS